MGTMAYQISSLPIAYNKRLFWGRSKKTSKLRVTRLFAGNSPVTGEFPAQMASKAENVVYLLPLSPQMYAPSLQECRVLLGRQHL